MAIRIFSINGTGQGTSGVIPIHSSNGLTGDGTAAAPVILGGTLNQSTVIQLLNFFLELNANGTTFFISQDTLSFNGTNTIIQASLQEIRHRVNAPNNDYSFIDMFTDGATHNYVQLLAENSGTLLNKQILLDTYQVGIRVTDTVNNVGLLGDSLFPISANNLQYAQYGRVVQNGNSGLTNNLGTLQLGGTLLNDTTVNANGKKMTFTGGVWVSNNIEIVATGAGVGQKPFIELLDSDGVTRLGIVGMASTANNDIFIYPSVGNGVQIGWNGTRTMVVINNLGNVLLNVANGAPDNGTAARLQVVGAISTLTMILNGSASNLMTRPAVGTARITGEISGYSTALGLPGDDGFLRLSGGGGTNANVKSYIDISGGSTVPDMDRNIVFGTAGIERMRINSTGALILTKGIINTSIAPGISAGAGAGTAPTIAVVGSNDGGIVTLTTGTAPTAGATIFTVTLSGGFAYPTSVVVTISPGNPATALVASYVFTQNANTFKVAIGATALAAATVYIWTYVVGGY